MKKMKMKKKMKKMKNMKITGPEKERMFGFNEGDGVKKKRERERIHKK